MNIVSVLPFSACGKRLLRWQKKKEKNNFLFLFEKLRLKSFHMCLPSAISKRSPAAFKQNGIWRKSFGMRCVPTGHTKKSKTTDKIDFERNARDMKRIIASLVSRRARGRVRLRVRIGRRDERHADDRRQRRAGQVVYDDHRRLRRGGKRVLSGQSRHQAHRRRHRGQDAVERRRVRQAGQAVRGYGRLQQRRHRLGEDVHARSVFGQLLRR